MGKLGKWYKNLKFRKKVLLSHLTVSLIPVMILGIFCYLQTRSLLIQREREVLRETLEQSILSMDSKLDRYVNVMNNITWDTNIREALAARYKNNLEMYLTYRDVIDPSVTKTRSLYPDIRQLTLYSSNQALFSHGDILKKTEPDDLPWADIQDYKIHWKTEENERLDLICRIYDRGNRDINIVYMSLDYQAVFGYLSGLFGDNYGIMIANGGEEPIYSFGIFDGSAGKKGLSLQEIREGTGIRDRYVMEQGTISSNGWKMYLYRPLRTVSLSAMSITGLIVIAVAICLLIILAVSITLTNSVVHPLDELISNIEQIEEGDLTVSVSNNYEDEIGHLIRSFSDMVERLNHMVNEVYKSKIAQQEYEMKALQAQINPHFLYNSLSLINWKAIMADQAEISEMAQLLSTFYRTTLNKGKNITTVKGEWDNTCSYVRIQNMLHSGKIDTVLEIDPEIMEYEILNLLLQPLVENAIVHGLDHKEGSERKKLCVTGKADADCLVFEVCDNGCGIPEDEAANILNIHSKGYGLRNVNHRIQLYYGSEYGLTIASRPGMGTRVSLRIPVQP